MTFLPEELRRPQKQAGPQLPPHDVAPLIDEQRQIAIALHPLRIHIPDHCFAGRPNHQRLLQLPARLQALFPLLQFGMRDHRALHGKPFHMLGLLGQKTLRNEQGKIRVDVSGLLEPPIQIPLHRLPDGVALGPDDHAPLDRTVIRKLGRLDDVEIPLCVILTAGFDVFGHGWGMLHGFGLNSAL